MYNLEAWMKNLLLHPCELVVICRVGLVQLVRFLVVELIHPVLNSRFDICVIFMANYSFSRRRCLRRQRDVLSDRLRESQYQLA
jgi:hypothetical protein